MGTAPGRLRDVHVGHHAPPACDGALTPTPWASYERGPSRSFARSGPRTSTSPPGTWPAPSDPALGASGGWTRQVGEDVLYALAEVGLRCLLRRPERSQERRPRLLRFDLWERKKPRGSPQHLQPARSSGDPIAGSKGTL